jgi:hypothetical protein
MQHLTVEEIARLVDELPKPDEGAHLAACERCLESLREMREQATQLSALPDLTPPDSIWRAVETELVAERLMKSERSRRLVPVPFLRAAAALVLFAAGTATGRLTGSDSGRAPGGPPIGATIDGGFATSELPPTSDVSEAARRLNAAEIAYLRALTAYAELTDSGDGIDPLNRLAALEGIVVTTRAALEAAPADPVINNYHLAAMGQREALLRQLETGPEKTWY